MKRYVYDIEVFPNYFIAAFCDYDTDERKLFEISDWKNDSEELIKFLKTVKSLISLNGIHYDDLHLISIIKGDKSNEQLFNLTQEIINNDNYDFYKQYKYFPKTYKITQIDLYLYWSKMLRLSKMLSLKSLAVQLNFPNIQELPIKPGTIIDESQREELTAYCWNDVKITKLLAKKMSDDINLRFDAKKKYGFKCESWDGPKLGSNILLTEYCKKFNLDINVVKEKQTIRNSVNFSDIILDKIEFKKGSTEYFYNDDIKSFQFKSFYGLYQYLKTKTVTSTKEISCRVMYKGVAYDIKSGGIHSFHKNELITLKEGYFYEDWDVESYYPSLGIEWEMVPEHMPGLQFLLKSLKSERSKLKEKGLKKSAASKLIKLALNGGFYGMTNNKYSPFYDWGCTLSITINGQLFLCMLCEWCEKEGIKVDMCNTDGVTFMIPENKYNKFREITKKWESLTKLKLEEEKFIKVIRKNINNYLAVTEHSNKRKGMFRYGKDIPLGDSTDNQIIPKALEAYFVHGTSVEQFIKNHNNIYDFTAAPKINKKFTVTWKGKIQQNLNRFYVSKQGAYLYKQKPDANPENVLKGYAVELFNKYKEKPMSEYNINYDWYIMKCREIINELEPKQMTLF